jgi:hypothetical protein
MTAEARRDTEVGTWRVGGTAVRVEGPNGERWERVDDKRLPRVAHNRDDLAFGQWIAFRDYDDDWNTVQLNNADLAEVWDFSDGRIVILADPPPEPKPMLMVPRDAYDRLVEAVQTHNELPCFVQRRAQAFVATVDRAHPEGSTRHV